MGDGKSYSTTAAGSAGPGSLAHNPLAGDAPSFGPPGWAAAARLGKAVDIAKKAGVDDKLIAAAELKRRHQVIRDRQTRKKEREKERRREDKTNRQGNARPKPWTTIERAAAVAKAVGVAKATTEAPALGRAPALLPSEGLSLHSAGGAY